MTHLLQCILNKLCQIYTLMVENAAKPKPEADPYIVYDIDPANPVRKTVHPKYEDGNFVAYYDNDGNEVQEGVDFVLDVETKVIVSNYCVID